MWDTFLKLQQKAIPAGTNIVCWHCGEHILTLEIERQGGDEILAEDFSTTGGLKIKNGDTMECQYCSKNFLLDDITIHYDDDDTPILITTPHLLEGSIRDEQLTR